MKVILEGIAVLALSTAVMTSSSNAQCVWAEDGSGAQCQTLLAGQTIEAGTVCAEVDGADLLVSYVTAGDWELSEVHLWVGADLADMPQTRKGSPKIGNFPYKAEDLSGSSTHQFVIPLSDLGFECPGDDMEFLVAAHASLRRPDGSGDGYQTETGWADGERFVERGMWGTFFSIWLTCDCHSDPPALRTCETAFAFGGDLATCFLDIDEDSDGIRDFSRWGWTNNVAAEDMYVFDIYAGAGRCDRNKGTLVGTLTVIYLGGSVDVIFSMNDGFEMDEVHLYAGSDILPLDVNGNHTVAPGQYPYVVDDLDGVSSHAILGIPASGPISVVAHAVVCSENWPED